MDHKPKHVALYLPSLEGGGAERMMVHLASGFADQEVRVDLVLVNALGAYLEHVPPIVKIINLNTKNTYFSAYGLIQYLRTQRPDALLSSLDLTNLIALLSVRISQVPCRAVIRIESTVSQQKRSAIKKRLERILLSQIYPWADNIVTVSRGAAQDLAQYTGIEPYDIQTIYNPVITPELLNAASEPMDYPWFKVDNLPVILGVGRFTEAKDFPTLLRAFSIVRQRIPARLVILGDGDERDNYQSMIQTLGIASDTVMPGFIRNPYPFMRKASVFVLSSRWEGLSNVLIEALACDCPVVSTNCPSGPNEILNEGEYGHLVPIDDPESMANAIIEVLNGDQRLPPKTWLRQFKLEPVVHQYLNLFGFEVDEQT